MPRRPSVIRSLPALRRATTDFRRCGETVALVPTMGALHPGHLALVRLAKSRARRVVVSIFVNPAQFAPHEDFATYPRSLERDLTVLQEAGVDLVWAPSVQTMYPPGFATRIEPQGAAKAGLEDAFRPHFYGGVATVVAKLLMQAQPDIAVFGEKDYQQLRVLVRLAADLDLPIKILGGKTVREPDGLAMSSRNAYLSPEERAIAPTLYRSMRAAAQAIATGSPARKALTAARKQIEAAGFAVDYLEIRNAETLAPVASLSKEPLRLLAAARLGRTRLIDNLRC